MRKIFVRPGIFVLFFGLFFQSCKKEIISTEQTEDLFLKNESAIAVYQVHTAIRKLDQVKNSSYNYEIALWVSPGADSTKSLRLGTDLVVNYELVAGNKTTTQTFKLKRGSYVTRNFVTLKGPVAITGIATFPTSYNGRPITFNNTIIEKSYDLQPLQIVGKNFMDVNGKIFTPWGANYTGTNELRLVDDNWTDPANWEIIQQDIREMKGLGINVIRIHLQYNRLMMDAVTPNQQYLSRLGDLLSFAGIYGMYVDITGLGAYVKEEQPAWYDAMDEQARWATQAIFWNAVASVAKNHHNIFCYNLMNEPVTPSSNTTIWLPGNGFGGFYYVQYITRTPNGRTWDVVTRSWIDSLKNAIRSEDTRTPVTVGFLGLGVVTIFNDQLEYNSPHVYPDGNNLQAAYDFVANNQSDHPLVIEETSWFNSSYDETEDFINYTQSQQQTAGYLSHYLGETIDQLYENGDLTSVLRAGWFELFYLKLNPNINKPIY